MKIFSQVTYSVLSRTLNPTILYSTVITGHSVEKRWVTASVCCQRKHFEL